MTNQNAPTYVLNYDAEHGVASTWLMDVTAPNLFIPVPGSAPETTLVGQKFCAVGNYLLQYDLGTLQNDPAVVEYSLYPLDPGSPLGQTPVKKGVWDKNKFWLYRDHYTWDTSEVNFLELVPMTGYVMCFMPTETRGSFKLFSFDAAEDCSSITDPLSKGMAPQDVFAEIGKGSHLVPMGNYVLEWIPAKTTYRLWNFDPQCTHPLSMPALATIQSMVIGQNSKLIPMGDYILETIPDGAGLKFRLWGFDPTEPDPLTGPLSLGSLPSEFSPDTDITSFQPLVPIDKENAATPGTMDFMRDTVDHVVVYMLESRTLDNVLGWLYENNSATINYVNAEAPYKGNSLSNKNFDAQGKAYPVYKFEGGKLSTEFELSSPKIDPFHATSDCVFQQFSGGFQSYLNGDAADMGGFVINNASAEPMASFSPEQLPVLNGLAASYGVCDEWFSPMPGGTVANRGFAASGSNYNVVVNYESDPQYSLLADNPQRQSVWKVLSNNGVTDWKIYYSVEWQNAVFTYHLYMRNQLPSVDAAKDNYVQTLDQFYADVTNGTLPKFSFVEPAWIAPNGATSYHPGASGDMVPAEKALKDLYDALRASPKWDRTALVITFSKGGGMYDHVSTPKATPGWPRDKADGFNYDVFGPRVPTIIVSSRVPENTVFRSGIANPFEASSILSTVLEWQGIPRARWGLGDRVPTAPTFETVFQLDKPRTDKPQYKLPYDSKFPPNNGKA